MDALSLHRIHFAFTVTYHYLFPQLTMGLALLIVVLKSLALKTNTPIRVEPASGPGSSPSISCSASSPESPWSSSSAPTGRRAPAAPEESSVCRSPWKASSASSSNPLSLASFSSARSASPAGRTGGPPSSSSSAHGSPASSSSSPTRGCSTRWPIVHCPTASTKSPASGHSC